MRLLYSLLMYFVSPFMWAHLAIRGFKDRGYWERWSERLAWGSTGKMRTGGIHIHAASVGEVNAASPLVNALLEQHPDQPLLITTFTPTGSRRVQSLWGDRVSHVLAPLDFPGATRRFYSACRPALVVIMETEIWPNLFHSARQSGAQLFMANARLSEKSLKGYRRFAGLVKSTLAQAERILVQSPIDKERFLSTGAPPHRVEITGNLKFDVKTSPETIEQGEVLRAAWGSERMALTAGSSHEADEVALLNAWRQVREIHSDALLVIVPRHPERFAQAAQLARDSGLETVLFSDGAAVRPSTACLVVDAMGELMRHYAAADIAFLGGTIAPVGGHNALEPAALGRPVLMGPNTANLEDIADALITAGGAFRVANADNLAATANELFSDAAKRKAASSAAISLVESGRGAVSRTLAILNPVLK